MFDLVSSRIKTFLLFLILITITIISRLPSIYNLSPQGKLFPPTTIFLFLSLITTLIYLIIIGSLRGRLKNIKNMGIVSRTLFLTPFTLVTIKLYILTAPALVLAPFFILASLVVHFLGIICVYLYPRTEYKSRRALYLSRKSSFPEFLCFFLNYSVSYIIILVVWLPLAFYHWNNLLII